MIPAEALQEVKKELEIIFGKGLAGLIMINARKKANPPAVMKAEHFIGYVDEIGSDERIVGMIGAAGTKQKLANWKKLVD